MRILFVIAAIVIVFMIARTLLKRPKKTLQQDARKPLEAEKMVRCDHCGLHVPEHEAILTDGHRYCSPEHERQARLGRDG